MNLKQRKRVTSILTIAIPILSTVAIFFGLQIALATDHPLLAVASGSMSPTLEFGDLVIVQGISPSDIQVRDVIIFEPPQGGLTIHRVTRIQILSDGIIQFKTKGDANQKEDLHWIPEQSVHGRVLSRIPYLGWLALSPIIPITIITITAVIIFIWPEKSKRRCHASLLGPRVAFARVE